MNRFLNIYFVALPDPIGINKNITLHFVYDERRTPYLATPTINEQVDELLLRVGGPQDVTISFTHVPAAPADYQVRTTAAVRVMEHFKGDVLAAEALESGALVGIFPEQKCVKPGEAAPYRPGVAVLSKRTGTPIIPVGIVNANRVLPLDKKLPSLRHTVYVVFGESIDPHRFDSVSDLLDETRRRITALTRIPRG